MCLTAAGLRRAGTNELQTRYLPAFGLSAMLHLLTGMAVLWAASAASRPAKVARQAPDTTAVFVVAPTAPTEDSEFAGLNPLDRTHDEPALRRWDEPTSVSIGAFTFDVAKIADRARVLFPFLTPGLSLEHFALTPQRTVRDSLRSPLAATTRGQPTDVARPPLVLGDAALQSLIDQSWSRRDRWSAFQRMIKLANTYSPDTGQLPGTLQKYLEQNWLQPYTDTTIRDPRLWTELGLAADHVSFVGFISQYASDHPSTRATTELLFLLDKVAQASRDALVTLLDTDPGEQLQWTRHANRHAYDVIVALRRYYAAQIDRKGLTSSEALSLHYDSVRLAILTGILRTTPDGYRSTDARFLIGMIYWRQGKAQEALQSWRDMTVDPADSYATASSDILTAIRAAGPHASLDRKQVDPLSRHVNRILDAEHGRWIAFSFDRLRQFGYRFDTF
jgi:hypothetical protein